MYLFCSYASVKAFMFYLAFLCPFFSDQLHAKTNDRIIMKILLAVSLDKKVCSVFLEVVPSTVAALPTNIDASAAYHCKWRNVYFELSQTL